MLFLINFADLVVHTFAPTAAYCRNDLHTTPPPSAAACDLVVDNKSAASINIRHDATIGCCTACGTVPEPCPKSGTPYTPSGRRLDSRRVETYAFTAPRPHGRTKGSSGVPCALPQRSTHVDCGYWSTTSVEFVASRVGMMQLRGFEGFREGHSLPERRREVRVRARLPPMTSKASAANTIFPSLMMYSLACSKP